LSAFRRGQRPLLLTTLTSTPLILALAACPPAAAGPPATELVKIPILVGQSPHSLAAKIYKPEGDGPFPAIILTHGTSRVSAERRKISADTQYKNHAAFLADKGYVVLLVVRRGFGDSAAPYAEHIKTGDGKRDYAREGLEAAKDLQAAIEFIKTRPYTDPQKIILVGQSTGGHSVLAAASLNIPGVIGAINFAGGRGSYAPDQVQNEDRLIASMAQFGKTSRLPTLWLYAENDRYFRPELARAMLKAYTDAGGRAKFISLPPYSDDGHRSFVGNRKEWAPHITDFLAEIAAP